jgi:hypothetical protein
MLPLWLKIIYSVFVAILVPIYWKQYGPANFLWFSDIALLTMLPALWLENALLVSMMALSILLLELVWNIDFWTQLVTGKSMVALSAYMFEPNIPLFIRGLSLFHVALPVLVVFTGSGTIDAHYCGKQSSHLSCCRFPICSPTREKISIGSMVWERNRNTSCRNGYSCCV